MKYMTPQLHQMIQETGDAGISAHDQWEANGQKYLARMAEIDEQCKGDKTWAAVQKFRATCCLHDAEFDMYSVLPNWGGNWFQMVIRQQNFGPDKFCVLLRYKTSLPGFVSRFEGEGEIKHFVQERLIDWQKHDLPIYDQSDWTEEQREKYIPTWLYDEFDLFATAEAECSPYYMSNKEYTSKPATYSHNILLCNGAELRILFTDFNFVYLPETKGLIEG